MSSTTATYGYGVSSFFCNYYCPKWYHKHRICNWLVKGNKFGEDTFWVRYFFRASILSLVLFSETFWKKLACLFCKSLLPFLTFVNCEGPYLTEGFLHNLWPCFDIVFVPLGVITRTNNNIVEIVAASERYLLINYLKKYRIKEAAVPDIPSRKISWRKNVNEKGKSGTVFLYFTKLVPVIHSLMNTVFILEQHLQPCIVFIKCIWQIFLLKA